MSEVLDEAHPRRTDRLLRNLLPAQPGAVQNMQKMQHLVQKRVRRALQHAQQRNFIGGQRVLLFQREFCQILPEVGTQMGPDLLPDFLEIFAVGLQQHLGGEPGPPVQRLDVSKDHITRLPAFTQLQGAQPEE